MKTNSIDHEFVDVVPQVLQTGKLYICIQHATSVHLCCCGCGNEVVTPLTPTDWSLIFDGRTVSLYPSIGNWAFPCNSHYWIKKNRIEWAKGWTREQIAIGRQMDSEAKEEYFESNSTPLPRQKYRSGWWRRFWR